MPEILYNEIKYLRSAYILIQNTIVYNLKNIVLFLTVLDAAKSNNKVL